MSATLTRSRSGPRCSVPRCGLSVVNGYAATSGVAREMAPSSDDLP